MTISVKYAAVYQTQEVTEPEYYLVQQLYKIDQKVMAIKFMRQQYCLGLKETKDICDSIAGATFCA